jgi:sensor histidine kinase YesM
MGRALQEGIGLANTRARLRQLHGEAAALELANRAEGGTRVRLVIPRRPAAPSFALAAAGGFS